MPALCLPKLVFADRNSCVSLVMQHYTCPITMPFVFSSYVITLGSLLDLGKHIYLYCGSMYFNS